MTQLQYFWKKAGEGWWRSGKWHNYVIPGTTSQSLYGWLPHVNKAYTLRMWVIVNFRNGMLMNQDNLLK